MARSTTRLVLATRAFSIATIAATRHAPLTSASSTREVIAVYLGTEDTDNSGMLDTVRKVRAALQREAAASGRTLVMRGVSLEPGVEDGIRHLARTGIFDEVSLGGNWTNSGVVRYLGNDMRDTTRAVIPQIVLLERVVQRDSNALTIGAEREIGRHIGTQDIGSWLSRGAPLP